MSGYTEDHLVEQPAIQLMQDDLGWEVVNCYDEWTVLRKGPEEKDGLVSQPGRQSKREVVLVSRLRPALQRLNPDLPVEAIEGAVEKMAILNSECWILNGRGRRSPASRLNPFHPALSLAEANREIGKLLAKTCYCSRSESCTWARLTIDDRRNLNHYYENHETRGTY